MPDFGDACGQNLITEAALAAGLGMRGVLFRSRGPNATITIIGSPVEKHGKIQLIKNGWAFDDIDLAMMVQPGCEIEPDGWPSSLLPMKHCLT